MWRNVTPTFIRKALHREALPAENGGIASRDFIYVEDLAHQLMACTLNGVSGETYNLASGVETTIARTRENRDRIAACMMQHARYVPHVRMYSA